MFDDVARKKFAHAIFYLLRMYRMFAVCATKLQNLCESSQFDVRTTHFSLHNLTLEIVIEFPGL